MALADFQRIDHFGDPAAEATACRTACALFDFSFLESAQVHGDGARQAIEAFTGRSLARLQIGQICYALRVGATGYVIADLTIWRIGAETFEVMSGRREDVADLAAGAASNVTVIELDDRAVLALQGPASLDILRRLGGRIDGIEALPYFRFIEASLDGIACRIGRLGYTGEPGFEIICPDCAAERLWQVIALYARPAGFIALDKLRIEAGFVLFSNEFRLPITPAEAGLGKFYQAAAPPRRIKLISFMADADRLVWPWQPSGSLLRPSSAGEIVVTSACESVVAGGILGLGYALAEDEPDASLRDRSEIFRNIRQTPLPYYDTGKRRTRLPWHRFSGLSGS